MLFGSCIGVLTWAAWMQVSVTSHRTASNCNTMQVIVNSYIFNLDPTLSFPQSLFHRALDRRWRGVYSVLYAIEFFCLSVAKLIVLDRMSGFAVLQSGRWSKRWVSAGRVVMVAVVAVNFAGLAGSAASAVHFDRASDFFKAASADFAANITGAGAQSLVQANRANAFALEIVSVQSFCEVAVLLIIVAAFAVAGIACARRVSSAMILLPGIGDAAAGAAMLAGRQLRRQIVGTALLVFVTFLVRSAYAILYAVALSLQNQSNVCPGNTQSFCNPSCYNVYTHIIHWMFWAPQFLLSIVLITKPLPLLVALWGMTSGHMFVIDQVVMQTKKHNQQLNLET